MTLPLSIGATTTTQLPILGPVQSTSGATYAFYESSTGTLQAVKCADPTAGAASFASAGSAKSFSASALLTDGSWFRVGDIVHVAVMADATVATPVLYCTFDMSSDTWGTVETVATPNTVQTWAPQVVVRANGEVCVFHQGDDETVASAPYWRVNMSKRVSGTWTLIHGSGVLDVTGAAVDYQCRDVVAVGNRIHVFISGTTSATSFTVATVSSTDTVNRQQFASFTTNSTIRAAANDSNQVFGWCGTGTGGNARLASFTSADTPSVSVVAITITSLGQPRQAFGDGSTLYAAYRLTTDNDYYTIKSTDGGATWSTASPVSAYVGTMGTSSTHANAARTVVTRSGTARLSFIVWDTAAAQWRYSEYDTGRAVSLDDSTAITAGALTLTGQTIGQTESQAITAGAITLTGQTIGQAESTPITPGSLALTGATVGQTESAAITPASLTLTGATIGQTESAPITPAALTLTGQTIGGVDGEAAGITPASLTLTGQTIGQAESQAITPASLTLTGQTIGTEDTAAPAPPAARRALGGGGPASPGFRQAENSYRDEQRRREAAIDEAVEASHPENRETAPSPLKTRKTARPAPTVGKPTQAPAAPIPAIEVDEAALAVVAAMLRADRLAGQRHVARALAAERKDEDEAAAILLLI